MEKINFENLPNTGTPINKDNLNKMQDNIEKSCVIVSPTQPTTNEKVWIKKGKNFFKDDLVKSLNNITYSNGVVTQVTADTAVSPYFKMLYYKDSQYIGNTKYTNIRLGINSMSFVKDDTFNIIAYGLNGDVKDTMMTIDVTHLTNGETYTLSFNVTNKTQGNISWKDIQLEQGSTATEYEEYIEKKIYIKNDNGVFEEFINAENEPSLESISQLISITPAKGSNYEGYGNSYYYKKGSTVYVHLGLSNLTVNTLEVIYTLPVGHRPNQVIAFSGIGGDLTQMACGQITDDGTIKIQSPSSYALFDFCFKAFK